MSSDFIEYFGRLDASHENIKKLYPQILDNLDEIKNEKRPKGKYIIGGMKGSGKTAFRKIIESKHKKYRICIPVDQHCAIKSRIFDDNPTEYFHLVANWILMEIGNKILKSPELYTDDEVKSALPPLWERIRTALKGVIRDTSVRVNLGVLELDFGRLETRARQISPSRIIIEDYYENYKEILRKRPAYFLIDDVDHVFEGSDESDKILDSALRAVCEINEEFNNLITVIVFPKISLSRQFKKKGKESDKYMYKFLDLSWSPKHLIELIVERIKQIRKLPEGLSQNEVWKHDFTGTRKIQNYLVSLCANGPRDMIELTNLAKEKAGSEKIQLKNIRDARDEFVKTKFDQLNRDFGIEYEEIGDLTQSLLVEFPDQLSRKELENRLEEFNLSKDILNNHPEWRWYAIEEPENLINILYESSVIGVKPERGRSIYFINEPDLDIKKYNNFVIHPAFRYI